MKQEQQNIISTNKFATTDKPESEASPTQESKTQDFFLVATKESGKTYSDLTGRYPIISSRRNQYISICYNYDTNGIQATPTKTRNAAEIWNATMSMLNTFTTS